MMFESEAQGLAKQHPCRLQVTTREIVTAQMLPFVASKHKRNDIGLYGVSGAILKGNSGLFVVSPQYVSAIQVRRKLQLLRLDVNQWNK